MAKFEPLARALELGREKHPNAPDQHHAAYANSVAYAVTGWSGGYGGPSMREHWASRVVHQAGTPGEITFDEAILLVEETCYGPLTKEIAYMSVVEQCFNDAPGEEEEAARLLLE